MKKEKKHGERKEAHMKFKKAERLLELDGLL